MPYLRRVFLLPPSLEEPFVADLWLEGTLGVLTANEPDGRLRLEAWFDAGAPEWAPGDWPERGVCLAAEETIEEQDWFATWRSQAQPFPVGRTFFLDPREPEEELPEVPEDRHLLRLPARAAFGTGSHESTSLALEILETMDLSGRRVLDVGTGTGVLSFAALLGGASLAVGYDVDPAAPFHARDNSRLNDLQPLLFAGRLAALREAPLFDLAVVNVVPEQILPEMPGVTGRLRAGGEAVLSGILRERGRQVLDRMRSLGFLETDRREAGDWIAFRMVRS
ncbi:MAG TPA: 50S ribosomal protein L11 methyltransferase [Thermoanaerobaculia bacterium]|nr:50S ribosomal protein L11 methyltransferase [Thermoanaerobaculia bacterium]